MPHFAILEHDWPARHWDLLLERDGVLKAWRLLTEPSTHHAIPAVPNFDHRPLYLDYEGPLSGDRGSVARWDFGELEWESESTDRPVFVLHGRKMTGRFAVTPTGENSWVLAPR